MKRFAAAGLVIFAMTASVVPQSIDAGLASLITSRNYDAAITELLSRRSSNLATFSAANYDHVLGRVAEVNGNYALAVKSYQESVANSSSFTLASMRQMSQIARSTGNLMLERVLLVEQSISKTDAAITRRLAENQFESGNYAETIRILKSKQESAKNDLLATRDANALLGEAYLRLGQNDQARAVFNDLIYKMPNPSQPDDAALKAAKGLDILDGNITQMSEADHRIRANIYQFNRDYLDARRHFEALISQFPNETAADAIFQIGRGFTQQEEPVEALKWYERVLEQYPESVTAKDALLQTAAAYSRVGKPKEAIRRYQRFIEKYPDDDKLERAYLNIVDIHRDQSEDQEALKWCEKTEERFKGAAPEAVAMFAAARIHLSREDWPNALAALERLRFMSNLGGNSPGGTNIAEVNFLKAYSLEHAERYSEAIDTYLSIADGRNEYYGWQATEHLKMLATSEKAKPLVTQKLGNLSAGLSSKDANTRRVNAHSILRIESGTPLAERALTVLKAAIRDIPAYAVPNNSVSRANSFSGFVGEINDDLAGRVGSPYPEMSVESAWKKVPADLPIEVIPREQLRGIYPIVYPDAIVRYAASRKVDPRFVLAIMRVESRFQPAARSNAAARGLMQFISPTSIKVASELGRTNFHQDELYYGPTAILFGSQYLADIFKVFPSQSPAVAASYNGGEENMKRWLARSRSGLPERYVPEIMFAQSKDYTYKVMAGYRMYQLLYDEQLMLR